ncbi:MAG: hypothetical protein LH617_11330 [Ramlibacter sp.]|nr:hypothetical protein [Ramlibacter sp.]
MKKLWIATALAAACATSLAKLPPVVLDDAAKAKAAETAAKSSWQGKLDAFQVCRAQDRVAAFYRKSAGSVPSNGAKATPPTLTPAMAVAMGPAAAATAAKVSAAPAAAAPVASSAAATAKAPITASAAAVTTPVPAGLVAAVPAVTGGTAAAPAGAPTPTPCADPGPFAYNAPAEKPLEASGAHSPAGNATSPPSVRANSAEMAPAKK